MKENHSSQNAQESGTSSFTRLRSKLSFERMVEMGAKMGMENPLFLCHERAAKATTVINGKEYINFSTYDYLDLNTHPEITEAVTEAARVFGSSAGASRLVGGERPPHRQLERALADFYGVEDCIAYVSGHATNVSTLGFLFGHRDAIFYDGLAHNSLMQGARLSGADRYSYEHNDCEALEKMLKEHRGKHKRACIVTEGLFSMDGNIPDLPRIIELKKKYDCMLLVDEAHGAHYLPFAARYGWRGGAVAAGADLVVQSAHKTLPSLTQTAFLQLNGDLADPAEVERQLDVFETSSPSYPLMVSLDGCTRWLADEGEAAFAAWRARLDAFDAAVRDLKNTKILCCGADALTAHPDFFAHDSGKILLQIGAAGAAYLRADGFEPEMVCGPNVLAMTSPCDDADALERLADVLHAWDKTAAPPAAPRHILPAPGAARCTIAEALLRPARAVRMRDAVGETAAEYLWAYPPGVPLVAPGEEVTAELVTACRALEQAGTALKHTGGSGAEEIAVL